MANAFSKQAQEMYRNLSRQAAMNQRDFPRPGAAAAAGAQTGPDRAGANNQLALKMIAIQRKQQQQAKEQQRQNDFNRKPLGAANLGLGQSKPQQKSALGGTPAPQPNTPDPAAVKAWNAAVQQNKQRAAMTYSPQALNFYNAIGAQWDNPEGKNVDQWIQAAIQHEGLDPSIAPQWKAGLAVESASFDPNAENKWDSNAQRGTPSIGPAQVIQPTFDAHADPGWNIRNPIHNITAGSRYARGRYGANWLKAMLYGSDMRPGGSTGY